MLDKIRERINGARLLAQQAFGAAIVQGKILETKEKRIKGLEEKLSAQNQKRGETRHA